MNDYTVIASKEFEAMLSKRVAYMKFLSIPHIDYITSTISNFSSILQRFPFAFPRLFLPNDNSLLRKIVIDKRYLLIYQVTDNIVEILYFVDGRRSYENMLTY